MSYSTLYKLQAQLSSHFSYYDQEFNTYILYVDVVIESFDDF